MFHVKHAEHQSGNRLYFAGGVDVGNQLPGALLNTDAAGGAFCIVDGGVVIRHGDGSGGTVLLTQAAANTACISLRCFTCWYI